MGLFSKKISFPSTNDVDKAEEKQYRRDMKRAEREAYREGFKQARVERAKQEGAKAGGRRWYDSFANLGVSKPVYVETRTKGGKRRRKKVDDPFDMMPSFDMVDNHGFWKK